MPSEPLLHPTEDRDQQGTPTEKLVGLATAPRMSDEELSGFLSHSLTLIVGKRGSGKSNLAGTLSTVVKKTTGTVTLGISNVAIFGYDLTHSMCHDYTNYINGNTFTVLDDCVATTKKKYPQRGIVTAGLMTDHSQFTNILFRSSGYVSELKRIYDRMSYQHVFDTFGEFMAYATTCSKNFHYVGIIGNHHVVISNEGKVFKLDKERMKSIARGINALRRGDVPVHPCKLFVISDTQIDQQLHNLGEVMRRKIEIVECHRDDSEDYLREILDRAKATVPSDRPIICLTRVTPRLWRTEVVRELLFNGRHLNCSVVVVAGYSISIPPELRAQADRVWLGECSMLNIHSGRKRMFDQFGGIVSQFNTFKMYLENYSYNGFLEINDDRVKEDRGLYQLPVINGSIKFSYRYQKHQAELTARLRKLMMDAKKIDDEIKETMLKLDVEV